MLAVLIFVGRDGCGIYALSMEDSIEDCFFFVAMREGIFDLT